MKTAALLVASLLATSAFAAPKGRAAKKEFAKGVAAYQKGDFAAASTALGKSYKLEPDTETLFAWAQSERQQNKCESAIDLYNQLLAKDMPAENKDAVRSKLDECRAIIAAKTVEKPVEPPKKVEPVPKVEPIAQEPAPIPAREEPTPQLVVKETRRPWYKDPIGNSLTIAGVVSLGAGGYFLYSAKQAEDKSKENDSVFEEQQDKAESRGRLGVVFTVAGGVLIVSGIVRYVTRPAQESSTQLTGWVTESSGGVAAFGRF
jgi:tetratricopeptide (TPR) repeat protein